MKESFLEWLVCPYCGHEKLRVLAECSVHDEIREGKVVCALCKSERPVKGGIVDLLLNTEVIGQYAPRKQAHVSGVATSVPVESMECDSMEKVSKRNDLDRAWVSSTETDFEWFFSQLKPSAGLKVLEIGAGTCWATARFAGAGCQCVAADILTRRKLECGDYWFGRNGAYFERILCSMEQLHFRRDLFDIVFTCATLMCAEDLLHVLNEIARVLKPNGRLVICAEPIVGAFQFRTRRTWHLKCSGHVYTLLQWKRTLRKAGFEELRISFPYSVHTKLSDPSRITNRRSLHFLAARAISPFWKIEAVRRLIVDRLVEPWLFLTPVTSPFVVVARRND